MKIILSWMRRKFLYRCITYFCRSLSVHNKKVSALLLEQLRDTKYADDEIKGIYMFTSMGNVFELQLLLSANIKAISC